MFLTVLISLGSARFDLPRHIHCIGDKSPANWSTDCLSRYLEPFETWGIIFPPRCAVCSSRAVFCTFCMSECCSLSWWRTSCQLTPAVLHHILSGDLSITTSIPFSLKNVLWIQYWCCCSVMFVICTEKKWQNPSFYYLSLYINWPCQVIFCKDFCQSVWLLWSIWTCCLLCKPGYVLVSV